MNYLSEAFKKLDFLTEEDFSLYNAGSIDEMGQFLEDPGAPAQDVIDPEAETEEELQDNYIGKVILHCPVCNSMIYKNLADIVKDDVEELVNVGEDCPYCYTCDGFKVIGIVSPFKEGSEEAVDDNAEPVEEEEAIEEGLKEEFEQVEVATDDQKVTLDADDDGKVTIEAEIIEQPEEEEEVLTPVPVEVEDAIEETEEVIEPDDGEIDYDVEDFDEESFDKLGESYLKSVYENVSSYKTTDVSSNGNSLVVEGMIEFNSGKMKPTKFIFEAKTATKNNKLRFIGENKNITRGRKAFTITGTLNENKSFITERFNYNYMTKNESGKSTRIYGTLKNESLTEAQDVNLSEKGNTINKLLLDNKDAIDGAASQEDLVKVCEDALADKGGAKAQQFLQVLKAKKNHYAALKYVYDFILAGEGQRSPDSQRKSRSVLRREAIQRGEDPLKI